MRLIWCKKLIAAIIGIAPFTQVALAATTDWSKELVDSTIKRYPTAESLKGWGYAKSLYLYGQYLVYLRAHDKRYLDHIQAWIDLHIDDKGTINRQINALDYMLPGNLCLILYRKTKQPKYKGCADSIRNVFDTYPRTKDNGFWHADTKSREWQLWADGVFKSLPFVTPAQSAVDIVDVDRARVIRAADQYLRKQPVTITSSSSTRSAGGQHDFFSEGDYWWPNPNNPTGPYIQRDGMSNPDNFVEHRRALMRVSVQVPALAAGWMITGKRVYADKAAEHLRAWFINQDTRMNPNLQYAQAIKGVTTGRGIGIIDTIHLVEVARAIEVLENSKSLSTNDIAGIKKWFADYLEWMTTSKNGLEERDAKNNHGTCWVMQVAAFAQLVGNKELLDYCRNRFKSVIVPNQIEKDGSFPQELRRTKPYGYSLFNLEAMAAICQILSTPKDSLWKFETSDGRGIRLAMEYMFPYIRDKKTWPQHADVMYDSEWPKRQNSLLFAGVALQRPEYIEVWKTLRADSNVEEVIRNFFIRQPVLWIRSNARKA